MSNFRRDTGKTAVVPVQSNVIITEDFIQFERKNVRWHQYYWEPSNHFGNGGYSWHNRNEKQKTLDRIKILNDGSVYQQKHNVTMGMFKYWGKEKKIANDCMLYSIEKVHFKRYESNRAVLYLNTGDSYDKVAIVIMSEANAQRVQNWFETHKSAKPDSPLPPPRYAEPAVGWTHIPDYPQLRL
tara:strand:- start:304 stop:855 length:552 start_codon:yes stop_codon:yes gene_type:complete